MYKAKCDEDEGVIKGCKKIRKEPKGYERVDVYAISIIDYNRTLKAFLREVKKDMYYATIGTGDLVIFIGAYKKIGGQ